MEKISNWILHLSAEKIAKLLVVFPVVIFLIVFSLSFSIRSGVISQSSVLISSLEFLSTEGLFFVLLLVILFWSSWIWATVISVKEETLGLKKKWFRYSFYFFTSFIIWQIIRVFLLENSNTIFNKESDIIPFINETLSMLTGLGLFIGYPVICHYAASSLYAKKTKEKTTFIKVLGYSITLILIPISIPFFHLYFHEGLNDRSKLIKLYAIALFLLFVLFCIALITALTGAI